MKLKKFFKDAVGESVNFRAPNGDLWVARDAVAMKVPDGFSMLGNAAAGAEEPLPGVLTGMIYGEDVIRNDAHLSRAAIPADGKIRECIRYYTAGDCEMGISNDAWGYIESTDIVEMIISYDIVSDRYNPESLLILRYADVPTDPEIRVVGIILPEGLYIMD